MPRYHVVCSTDPTGSFTEFSAADDNAARTYAEQVAHGARIVYLAETQIRAGGDIRRELDLPRTPAPLAVLHAYNAAHADEAITAVENPLAIALADVDNAREAYENRGYHDTDAYVDVLERLTEAVRAQLRTGPRTRTSDRSENT